MLEIEFANGWCCRSLPSRAADRKRLSHPSCPIQEVRLVHSRARLDQRKRRNPRVRAELVIIRGLTWPEPTTGGSYRLPVPL
ncbi:MAG: hypothetical protein ACXVY6_13675 [Gaiellaceae bacterium]